MLKKLLAVSLLISAALIQSCKHHDPHPNTVIVGTIAGPETELMQVAKIVAKQKYGLDIEIMPFHNYYEPNKALYNGIIEANAIQDKVYLEAQNREFGYHFVILGNTFMYPMGLYSYAISRLSQLKKSSKVAIPSTDIGRTLLMLQSAHLISIQGQNPLNIGLKQITHNPKNLDILPTDPVLLTQEINRVELAAINTNYSKMVGLLPSKNALFVEPESPLFMNVIVTRQDLQNEPKMQKLVKSYQSHEVYVKARELFGSNAIPGFRY